MKRIIELDFTRGIAVNLMILAHIGMFTIITLKNLNLASVYESIKSKTTIKIFDLIGVFAHTLFLVLVGINMVTSYKKNENLSLKESRSKYIKKNVKRGLFVGILGLIMSFLTFIIFGDWFIIFGIFQFIAISIFLTIPIQLYYNEFIVIIGVIFCLVIHKFIQFPTQNNINIFSIITGKVNKNTKYIDFFPILPYFGLILLGLIIGNIIHKDDSIYSKFNKKQSENKLVKEISFMGKWSIQIYFLHIILIFCTMKLVLGKSKINI